jgi:2-keto-4-pentenoate hydratase/2-oxohepta-3-ene-1,7-dioic acid hydratase in catechol pathway
MRIATFQLNGQREVGLVSADGKSVTPLAFTAQQAQTGAQAVIDLLIAGQALAATAGQAVPTSDVRLEAPLPLPRRSLWCVCRNYHAHAKELSASVFKDNDANPDSWPIVFTKVPECVVGPHDAVQMPVGVSDQIDYEAELAVVIGKGGKNITRADALAHVFGYTVVNDVTARDVQMRHQQWDMGKSFDTFCPMGP